MFAYEKCISNLYGGVPRAPRRLIFCGGPTLSAPRNWLGNWLKSCKPNTAVQKSSSAFKVVLPGHVALRNHRLLREEDLLRRNLHAQVPAGDHDAIRPTAQMHHICSWRWLHAPWHGYFGPGNPQTLKIARTFKKYPPPNGDISNKIDKTMHKFNGI